MDVKITSLNKHKNKPWPQESSISKAIHEGRIKIVTGRRIPFLPALGSVAALGSSAISLLDMFDNLGENDVDSAVGHGIAAAGFTVMGLALLDEAGSSFGLAALTCFTPYLWVAAGAILIGVLIANACNNSPIEVWAANGPFCNGKGDQKFQYLRDISHGQLAYNSLANCLFTPRIEISRLNIPVFNESQEGDIRVKVYLPNFTVGQDEIDVRTYHERAEEVNCITNQVNTWGKQTHAEPYIVKQCTNGLQVTAMEFFYHSDFSHPKLCRWAAKARIIMAKGPILPDPEYPQDAHKAKPVWVYAELS